MKAPLGALYTVSRWGTGATVATFVDSSDVVVTATSDACPIPTASPATVDALLPTRGLAGRLRVVERPHRLRAVRRRDRHADPRTGAVRVALVVERDDELDERVLRHRLGIARQHARDRLHE